MFRKIFCPIIILFTGTVVSAQHLATLSLEQSYNLAYTHSPVYQQKALTIAAGNMAEKNLNLKWLPQLDINAQASYQSAVTSLPVKLPNVNIEELDKDQYKGTLDLVQPVFDGGVIAKQKKLQRITTEIEAQRTEVDLYQLKSTINTYYFTVLLMDENLQLMNLVKQDLNNSLKTVVAQVANGIATKSNEDLLNAELLKTEQQSIEFGFVKKQALENLALLTGAGVEEQTVLETPGASFNIRDTINTRPELKLFDFQQQQLILQSKLIDAKTNPRLSLFANGGYGKPGLNMLKNEFQWFYLTGVKFNIPVTGRITKQNDKAVVRIQEQVVQKQKENFLINNRQLLVRQKSEIEKYRQLVLTDAAIITLRAQIKENYVIKLSNGIVTTDDYIRELNAENQARLNQKLHQVSLLQAQYNYKILTGQ
ncbi:MAG: TolC family protein [Ferruginibacter sp.]|nr:TolC family protein [Ferruginibacter sp.]